MARARALSCAGPRRAAVLILDARRPGLVTLEVRDLGASVDFYQRVVGLPVKLRQERHAEMQAETFLVVLLERPDAPRAGKAHSPRLGWEVADLDAAAALLASRGAVLEPESPPDPGHGDAGRRRRFVDPDGHALEIVSHGPAGQASGR